ncbi:MAG TPA: hypothetical protein VMH77_00375 [Steroidobacteraceae bacterium]|nr:hypothetical protein [Steroidobacteraceae bacterium]
MKRAICVLLAACSVAATALAMRSAYPDEAAQPAAPTAADQIDPPTPGLSRILVRVPGPTCYFIRTIRPVTSEPARTGFIPVQARIVAVENGPGCTLGGNLLNADVRLQKVASPVDGKAGR